MKVGLTGGVGSGKSTVARRLAEHGAVVIDADAIAREVVAAGTAGFDEAVAHFGREIVGPDGELDRPALAKIVFADDAQRQALNGIVHPRVGQRVAELESAAGPDATTVYDVPLLVESDMAAGFDFVLVVLAPVAVRIARLAGRGMPEDDARARMASQATDEQRRAVADVVLDNDSDLAALHEQVDAAWRTVVAGGRDAPRAV